MVDDRVCRPMAAAVSLIVAACLRSVVELATLRRQCCMVSALCAFISRKAAIDASCWSRRAPRSLVTFERLLWSVPKCFSICDCSAPTFASSAASSPDCSDPTLLSI